MPLVPNCAMAGSTPVRDVGSDSRAFRWLPGRADTPPAGSTFTDVWSMTRPWAEHRSKTHRNPVGPIAANANARRALGDGCDWRVHGLGELPGNGCIIL